MNKETMLQWLNSDLCNEWKHLQFYLYHASAITTLHREEYREFLLKAAASEMDHVRHFQDVILGLGVNPVLPPPATFPSFSDPRAILQYALMMEEEVVQNYTDRIKQAAELGGADGQYLEIFLENQLQDSREDADNLKQILKGR